MDAVIRHAHRSVTAEKDTASGPFRRTRRDERRGDDAMSHPLMSSASCMLSMRKTNLQEVLRDRENKALAKRVMNVKSFCDPNGKDLEDYRRHQRMVQVRQEFHHYGGPSRAVLRHRAPEANVRPSRPRVTQSLSEANLHHLDSLLCPWELPKSRREEASTVAPAKEEFAETLRPEVPASDAQAEPTAPVTGGGSEPTPLQLQPAAEASAQTPTAQDPAPMAPVVAPLATPSPAVPAQVGPIATETALPMGLPDATEPLKPLNLLGQFNSAPLDKPALSLAPLAPLPTIAEPEVHGEKEQNVTSTAGEVENIQREAIPASEPGPSMTAALSSNANDTSMNAAVPSSAANAGFTSAESQDAQPAATNDRHADPFGDMGMFDKPPEFKTKRRRERPADA